MQGLNLNYSKKGNAVIDTAVVIIVVFAFVFATMIGFKLFSELEPEIVEDLNSNESIEALEEFNDRFPSVFDGLILFVFIGLWAFVIIASFLIDSNPIFFIIATVLLLFVLIVGAYIGNSYEEIFSDPDLVGLETSFPMTNWLMTHLLGIAIAIGVSLLLALYGKSRLS